MPTLRFTVYAPTKGYFIPGLDNSSTLEYRVGHIGTIEEPGIPADPDVRNALFCRIFSDGNGEGAGPGFTVAGRSMSAGDIVHVESLGPWLCDAVGWTPIPNGLVERFPLSEPAL